jgi:hypothetical protein
MIRYAVTKAALGNLIEAESKGWLVKAQARTEALRAQGEYREKTSIWSAVKPTYMKLQRNKCAYCERELEPPPVGKVEQDVEHFRPKRSVRPWKLTTKLSTLGITVTTAAKQHNGYHLLAYHIFNYAATCKPCNLGGHLKTGHTWTGQNRP